MKARSTIKDMLRKKQERGRTLKATCTVYILQASITQCSIIKTIESRYFLSQTIYSPRHVKHAVFLM